MDTFVLEMILLLGALVLPGIAHLYIMSTYGKYRKIEAHKTETGADIAREILEKNGLSKIYVVETPGKLSDHYDPKQKTVRLSPEVYNGSSVASLAIAAHEVGHAIQDKEGNIFMRIRSFIFPVVRIATQFSYIVIFAGFLLGALELFQLGIALMLVGLFFQLITLPVEFDASKKAKAELEKINISDRGTQNGVSKMLHSAALTYVAGVLASAMGIIRLILIMNRRS